ncbi:MAG: VWA domain-containing protein [Clostridia bacterium]|nr:VWA domain-containing protein [Clostridia bacterium]
MLGDPDLMELFGIDAWKVKKAVEEENNIRLDRYDRTMYKELLGASPELARVHSARPAPWPALIRDIWAAYYKADPELAPVERVSLAARANRPLVERVLEDAATREARAVTMLDELSSTVATIATGEQLIRELQERRDLRRAVEAAVEAANAAEADPEAAEALAAEAEQAFQAAARDLRQAVRRAVQDGRDKADEMIRILAGWGLEPADLRTVPLGERVKLAQRLAGSKMKRVAALVGRMRNLFRAVRQEKLKKERDEVHGITLGADLGRVLPAELAALRDPLRRLDFYRRFSERRLLEYELRIKEKMGKGPMVVLVDCSGSMSGRNIDWAAAVSLVLVDAATRQKRRAAVVHFNTKIVQEVEFAPGERNAEKFAQVASVGADGGTSYEPPFARAVELIEESEYREADIVMITDGECRAEAGTLEALRRVKDRRGTRIFAVMTGSRYRPEWADAAFAVEELTDEVAADLFQSLA